jgi:hypothetical protein
LAKQVSRGTPITADASFKYLLFNEGGISPSSVTVPLDPEVGGGAMLRDVQKMGVISGGQFAFTPRPSTLGKLLMGALGAVTTTGAGPSYSHAFALPTDQFTAPYYTFRSNPGGLFGEQFQDCRISGLNLTWRGANYLRGSFSVQGGLPAKVATTTWASATYVDGGPQFITPISTIELPTGTAVKVLGGSFTAGLAIPLDEQWIVGSYSPDDFDITSRAFAISMAVKITDGALYSQMAYDPAGGNAWAADVMREARIKMEFLSNAMVTGVIPYSLNIAANGVAGSGGNVVWSAAPIGLRAGRQVIMNITGVFLASSTAPITVTLVNGDTAY